MCSVTQHQWKCRQMCGKCSQIHPVHSLFVCYKKWLVFTEESIHFNVSTYYRMSSYANNNLLMCSVIQNQCRRRQMCGNFHKFTKYTHFLSVTKMTCLDWTIYSWKDFNSFGSPLMLRTNYSCVQSLNISVDVAKWVENFRKFTQYTHFLSVTKNYLSWLNNLFMERFQLICSSYAKNKLQLCSVTQHSVDVAKWVETLPWIDCSVKTSFFVTDKKWVYFVNLRKFSTHLATSTLMLSDWTQLQFVISIRGHPIMSWNHWNE